MKETKSQQENLESVNLIKESKLSVAIIAFNEERIIDKTLLSLSNLADEIIFVDSFSTDKTPIIAKNYQVTLFQKKWSGYSEQKNFAISKCTGNWILSLDADEVLTEELKTEIKEKINLNNATDGYKVARRFFIGEKLIKYGGYYPDYQLRLFKRDSGAKFNLREIHESIALSGKVELLQNPLNHYAYTDINDYKEALEKYSILASKEIKNKKYYLPLFRSLWSFIFRYFFRLGFLNGKLGFDLAKTYSKYVYQKYLLAKNINK